MSTNVWCPCATPCLFLFAKTVCCNDVFFLFESIIIMFSIIRKMFNDYNNIWHHSSIVLLQLRWLSFSWQPINHAFKKFCTTLNEKSWNSYLRRTKVHKVKHLFCVWLRLRSTQAKSWELVIRINSSFKIAS